MTGKAGVYDSATVSEVDLFLVEPGSTANFQIHAKGLLELFRARRGDTREKNGGDLEVDDREDQHRR